MLICLLMLVIIFHDQIEEVLELIVGVVTTCIDTNARVHVLAPRKDYLLEGEAKLILLVAVLGPNLSGKISCEAGLCTCREGWETCQILW